MIQPEKITRSYLIKRFIFCFLFKIERNSRIEKGTTVTQTGKNSITNDEHEKKSNLFTSRFYALFFAF